jgi:hypothetical protein
LQQEHADLDNKIEPPRGRGDEPRRAATAAVSKEEMRNGISLVEMTEGRRKERKGWMEEDCP